MKPSRYLLAGLIAAVTFWGIVFGLIRVVDSWDYGGLNLVAALFLVCFLGVFLSTGHRRSLWLTFALSGSCYLFAFHGWLRNWRFRGQHLQDVKWSIQVDQLWGTHSKVAVVFATACATLLWLFIIARRKIRTRSQTYR